MTDSNSYQAYGVDIQTQKEEESLKEKETQEDAADKKDIFSFSKTTRSQKFLIISLAFVNFCSANCFSLMAPFFPKEATSKGTSETVVGIIFGTFELTIFISAPVFGNNLSRIGAKFMYVSGVLVCAVCTVLFGLLDRCPDGTPFVVMCFLVRMVQALGAGAFITSSFAIISHEFPQYVTTVIGALETFNGFGMMAGPAIGSSLYVAGGFGLPFFLLGGIMTICGLLCWIAMPSISDKPQTKRKSSFFVLLKSPFCAIACIVTIFGTIALGFLDPTLQPRLGELDISTILVGVFFLSTSALYAITAPLWGWLTDTKGLLRPLLIIGNVLTGLSYLMLGPSPLLSFIPLNVWSTVVALGLFGIFIGAMLVPTYAAFTEGAFKQLGLEDNFDTHGMISGLFNCCWSLGAFIGPMAAGYLVEKFNFDWASTIFSALFFIAALLLVGYLITEKCSDCLPHNSLKSQYESIEGETNNNVDQVIQV